MECFAMLQHVLTIIVIMSTNNSTQASVIKFEAYPTVLKANLTSSASMRCSLADTNANGGQIGKGSVTSTADDIFRISAIVITRNNGQDVASVTPFDVPIAEADPGNLEVKGDLSGTSSQGFLELTWKDPSAMAMGEYVCEINAINSHHHPVMFTSTLEIAATTPTINDVIAEFKSHESELKTEIKDLKQQQTKELTKLETEINSLKKEQTTLKECASRQVGFMAVISSNFHGYIKSIPTNHPVVFDKVIYRVGGSYNQTTGKFTCSEAGLYSFTVHSVSAVNSDICLNLKLNSVVTTSVYSLGKTTVASGSTSALLHLKVNDVVQVVTDGYHTAEFYQDPNVFQSNVFVGHMVQSDCAV